MRISTANAFDASIDSLTRRQSDLADAQTKLTSLKRVVRASDDPTAAARAERALASIERGNADQRAVEVSQNAMTLTEAALGDAGELLHQARELLVASGNASFGDAQRKTLAEQLRAVRHQLLAIANRDDGAGLQLFGGHGSSEPPFVDAPGGVQYVGQGGQSMVASSEPLPRTVDGASAWLQARNGNGVFETRVVASTGNAWIDSGRVTQPASLTGSTYRVQFSVSGGATTYSILRDGAATAQTNVPYVAGQSIEIDGLAVTVNGQPANGDTFDAVPSANNLSIFNVLDRVAGELQTTGRNSGAIAQTTVFGLRDLDASFGRLQSLRSQVGETLVRADGVGERIATQKLQAQTERSNAEDLDMVHAVSDFQNQQSALDAALKSYSMVQRLSLFQYLGN